MDEEIILTIVAFLLLCPCIVLVTYGSFLVTHRLGSLFSRSSTQNNIAASRHNRTESLLDAQLQENIGHVTKEFSTSTQKNSS